jgi:hypothetical protein
MAFDNASIHASLPPTLHYLTIAIKFQYASTEIK